MIDIIETLLHKTQKLQPPKEFKDIHFVRFLEEYHFEYTLILLRDIEPKLLNLITNPEKQNNWKNYFDFLLPTKSLNYKSESEYLTLNHITIPEVIENSITHIPPDIDTDDLQKLSEKMTPLMNGHKVRILEDQTPVYLEIIHLMSYIQKINELIKHYKKPHSNYRGTAHRSSSLKDIIKKQTRMLDERLNGVYFRIQNEDEIEQTSIALKILNASQTNDHKNLIEQLNFARIAFGLDMKFWDFSENEKTAIEQVANFYNGARTETHELVRSVMIYMDTHFDKSNLSKKEKADVISYVTRFFYKDELKKAEKGKNKLAFTQNHVGKRNRVKTLLHDIPIYAYQYKDDLDFLSELTELAFSDMMGLKNIFEQDSPTLNEASPLHIARNIIDVRKQFDLTKMELKVILYFMSQNQATHEQKKLLDISTQN